MAVLSAACAEAEPGIPELRRGIKAENARALQLAEAESRTRELRIGIKAENARALRLAEADPGTPRALDSSEGREHPCSLWIRKERYSDSSGSL